MLLDDRMVWASNARSGNVVTRDLLTVMRASRRFGDAILAQHAKDKALRFATGKKNGHEVANGGQELTNKVGKPPSEVEMLGTRYDFGATRQ